MILETINGVDDLKKLNTDELKTLSGEIREYLIDTLKITGGHLASNLGAVEISIALHFVFSCPDDKIIWDVGHQSYVHKILTGRREELKKIRKFDGISGFPKREESPADCFDTGHASTSISAALGLARARDLRGETHKIIAVIGDGALTGGMTFEALNDIGNTASKMLIVFNDNEMSIAKNVGGLSKSMSKLRLSGGYKGIKRSVRAVRYIPLIGKPLYKFFRWVKNRVKAIFVKDKYFKNFGLNYIGPVDGHDIKTLIEILTKIRDGSDGRSTVLHINTTKGKGYRDAEDMPEIFHGVNADFVSGDENSFSLTLGETLSALAVEDSRVAAITAAMPEGTGLSVFKNKFPERFFDTGITEEHAVTMAAGLAAGGLKPYVAIYSTFLQRAFDQIMMDVSLQKLPVVFCLDRGGLSGADGETHQGAFDIGYLSMIPNMAFFAPKDKDEMKNFLHWSLGYNMPLAIRYPKNYTKVYGSHAPVEIGKWEYITKTENAKITFLAVGNRMLDIAADTAQILKKPCNIVNARWLKPLDEAMLTEIIARGETIITLEDNALTGGFNTYVAAFNNRKRYPVRILPFGIPDKFIKQGSVKELFSLVGLTPENIAARIKDEILEN